MALRLTEAGYARLAKRRGNLPRIHPVKTGRKWEDLFAAQLDAQAIAYEREYRFLPARRFRFDFAILPLYRCIAVEVDGAVHRIKAQFRRDREKHNLALIAGWRVLRVGSDDVRSGRALFVLECLLQNASTREAAAPVER